MVIKLDEKISQAAIVIQQKLRFLHINLLSVICKRKGLEIPTPGKSSPSDFC
jgi:hypothetical protein